MRLAVLRTFVSFAHQKINHMLLNRFKTACKQLAIQLRKYVLAHFPLLIRLFYRHLWRPKAHTLAAHIDAFSRRNPGLFAVQVGSNDGFQHDPLCKFIKRDGWRGLLFEPQKKAYQDLCYVYKHDAVKPVHAAIDRQAQRKKLYKVAFTDARWASGLSSFDPQQLRRKVADGSIDQLCDRAGIQPPAHTEDYLSTEEVRCVPFEEVFEAEGVQQVDLLQIDTEGYDYEILKLFDFDRYQPGMVIFEKTHLSEADYEEACAYLRQYGYRLQAVKADVVGWLEK